MNGYTESDEHVEWRMNRRRLKNIEVIYGAGWESDADNIHALIAAAEAGDEEYDNGLYDDPRTEWERDWDDHCAEVQATRESDMPRGW